MPIHLFSNGQAMISCCYYIVDEVMTSCYPWFASLPADVEGSNDQNLFSIVIHFTLKVESIHLQFIAAAHDGPDAAVLDSIKELNIRLRRLLHHGLSDFIDPTRLYTSPVLMRCVQARLLYCTVLYCRWKQHLYGQILSRLHDYWFVLFSALIGSSKISMANPHAMGRSKSVYCI